MNLAAQLQAPLITTDQRLARNPSGAGSHSPNRGQARLTIRAARLEAPKFTRIAKEKHNRGAGGRAG